MSASCDVSRFLRDVKRSREHGLVLTMIAARVWDPRSKLATGPGWQLSTLGERFGVADADDNALFAALDWLSRWVLPFR